ncbi:uncharacterized protein LOC115226230 [Octopus sinensis]|uniref:Uncharacterized protein LOC115226230 n=1 Tax=Octopus sinensis TaxID=2607531 RepID=A0A6P7TM84_9MOLL|nr:uncharacterized protein LOC115226230 [Octopus sinensis]
MELRSSLQKNFTIWIIFCFLLLTVVGMVVLQHMHFTTSSPTEVTQIYRLLENHIKQYQEIIELQIKKEFESILQKYAIEVKKKTEMTPNRTKYLIYKCAGGIGAVHCSGWGNRLVGILSTYMLSMATDRTFGIIMTNPCPLTETLVPNDYRWNFSMSAFGNMSSISIDVRNNNGFTNSLATIDFNARYPQDVVFIAANQDYLHLLQRNGLYKKKIPPWSRGEMYVKVFQSLFKLSPIAQVELDTFLKKARPNPETKLICAQIRIGKNPTIPWDNRVITPPKLVDVIWKFLNETGNNARIFVTADSENIRRLAKTYYGKRSVDTAGPIIHMDKPYRYNKSEVCEGVRKLILDQFVLIKCDTIVISTSSYARIPAMIHGPKNRFFFINGKIK